MGVNDIIEAHMDGPNNNGTKINNILFTVTDYSCRPCFGFWATAPPYFLTAIN